MPIKRRVEEQATSADGKKKTLIMKMNSIKEHPRTPTTPPDIEINAARGSESRVGKGDEKYVSAGIFLCSLRFYRFSHRSTCSSFYCAPPRVIRWRLQVHFSNQKSCDGKIMSSIDVVDDCDEWFSVKDISINPKRISINADVWSHPIYGLMKAIKQRLHTELVKLYIRSLSSCDVWSVNTVRCQQCTSPFFALFKTINGKFPNSGPFCRLPRSALAEGFPNTWTTFWKVSLRQAMP